MSPADASAIEGEEVVLGIDAGGSSIRARAVKAGRIVFDGVGGPGNPAAMTAGELAQGYEQALSGCPCPDRVAACVAGAGSPARQEQVRLLLAALLPGADILVYPDYFAPLVVNRDADVCVIAGTGSVVCSRGPGGRVRVSGGRGWVLGDPGSAAWLGRAVLGHLVDRPESFDEPTRTQLLALYGAGSPDDIVHYLHNTAAPAAELAAAAPVLSTLVNAKKPWAIRELHESMNRLAETTALHIARWTVPQHPVVALSGGVWESSVFVEAFRKRLTVVCPNALVASGPARKPVDGAVELALVGALT